MRPRTHQARANSRSLAWSMLSHSPVRSGPLRRPLTTGRRSRNRLLQPYGPRSYSSWNRVYGPVYRGVVGVVCIVTGLTVIALSLAGHKVQSGAWPLSGLAGGIVVLVVGCSQVLLALWHRSRRSKP
jgi:hypothetical protein